MLKCFNFAPSLGEQSISLMGFKLALFKVSTHIDLLFVHTL